MRLRALTALERQKVLDELAELRAQIADLKALLASDAKILDVVIEELDEIREKFGDERRTEITGAVEGLTTEDLIVEEDMVVTVSHLGYVEAQPDHPVPRAAPRRQGPARAWRRARRTSSSASSWPRPTPTILFFTNRGRVHWKKVYELPQLGRAARGKALVNLLQLGEGERVQATLPVRSFDDGAEEYVLIATRRA